MTCSAKIVKDSVSWLGVRLTTLEIVFPRCILAEINTHRMFSRNSASSRAIPVEKMLKRVRENPYVPSHWGQNQKGMVAEVEVDAYSQERAKNEWLAACSLALSQAERLMKLGIHKQVTNRLLEPFMWHTCIVSATEWSNFFHLRCNPQAHPEIQKVACAMRDAIEASVPALKASGEWHLPFVDDEEVTEYGIEIAKKVSVGRCARVSYLTHDGKRDINEDVALHDRLLTSGHMSPMEHPATPNSVGTMYVGPFRGWTQYRKFIPRESDILARDE
jgi:thymidylate synthase ThyX